MKRAHNLGKWVIRAIMTIVFVILLFVIVAAVIMLVAQRSRTLYTIEERGYEFRVVYSPGGGAIGSNPKLEVRVTGDKWSDVLMFKVEAVDSAEIAFVDKKKVKITVLKPFYRTISEFYWMRADSAIFDLAGEEITPHYYGSES